MDVPTYNMLYNIFYTIIVTYNDLKCTVQYDDLMIHLT